MIKKYAIFYGVILDTDDDGIFFDYLYFGGICTSEEDAEEIARDIANDRKLPGVPVTRIYKYTLEGYIDNKFPEIMRRANSQFLKQANDMYDAEEATQRRKRK